MRPVGAIDLLLDARAVKAAEGKSVDGENITLVLLEPVSEMIQRERFAQLPRGKIAQPQADGIGPVGAYPFFHRERVLFERGQGLGPVVAPVDVGAVGEMEITFESHCACLSRRLHRAGTGDSG
jgi:hypothetical protein